MDNTLYVRMFGSFSMTWNGKPLLGEAKSSETQFAYLMQLLLYGGREGVSRDRLEEILFGERDITDIHHATRSVIYNAKKKLKTTGLPEANYIEQNKGIYYWTDQIPLVVDATEMERLYQEAEAEKDLDKRLEKYLDACYCYRGEFLAAQVGTLWVAQEAKKFRAMFCSCVEKAVQLLRVSQNWPEMEELGRYASQVSPLADWETVTMEAIVSLGRYDDARKFYDDTVEMYFQEAGLRPSSHLIELLDSLGEKMEHQYAVLDDIQAELSELGDMEPGGYLCSYPVFQGIYRMVERMMERGGQSVYLMLCTVVDSKGNPMKEGPMLEELSQRLGDAIRHSVRHSDAINRYGKGQYLVLLLNTTRENCQILQRRINYHFVVGRQRTGIQYYVNSVVCTPGQKSNFLDKGKG